MGFRFLIKFSLSLSLWIAGACIPCSAQRISFALRDSVVKVAVATPAAKPQADAWLWLGRLHRRTNPDSTTQCYEKAYALYQRIGDLKGKHDTRHYQGYHQYKLGNLDDATNLVRQSVAMARDLSNDTLLKADYTLLGNVFIQGGLVDSAQTCYLKSLRLAEALKDTSTQIINQVLIGNIYYQASEYADALPFYQKALKLSRLSGDGRNEGMVLGCLASTYQAIWPVDSLEAAIRLTNQGLEILSQYRLMDEYQFAGYLNQAIFNAKLGREAPARAGFEKAKAIAEGQKSDQKRSALYYSWGLSLVELHRPAEAANWLRKAYDIALTNGDLPTQKLAAGVLSEAYRDAKDWALAYEWNETYYQLKDSIGDAEVRTQVANLNIQFETEKKDRELAENQVKIQAQQSRIRLLVSGMLLLGLILAGGWVVFMQRRQLNRQRIRELEKEKEVAGLRAMMEGEEKERVRLAKELHDGLGGLLSAAKLQFTALAGQAPALADDKGYQQGIALLDTVSSEARKISHNLMPEMLSRLGLVEAVRQFCTQMSASGPLTIDFEYFGPETRLRDSLELSIYRILQELVNNVIKHAGATEATVQMVRDEQVLAITVEDNGRGFAPVSQPGIGMDSIHSRLQFLGGKMDVQSDPEKGASVFIEIILSR